MSSLEHATKRPRSLSELSGHAHSVATELAEWGYVFTGHDGKGAAIMAHPAAGVVRIHKTPKSKSGARISILKLACQQLRHIGVEVDLPWRPHQPKKEVTLMPVTVSEDKVRLDSKGVRDRITALSAQGKLGQDFTVAEVYDYLNGRYTLPTWSGDNGKPGYVVVSQALTALVKNGSLYREKEKHAHGMRYRYRSAFTEQPVVEDVPLAVVSDEPTHIEVPVVDTNTGEVFDAVNTEHAGDVQVARPEATPAPDEEPVQALAAEAPPIPAEALDILRGYFVGDMEAENELLREAFTGVVSLLAETAATLNAAAQDAAEALSTLGTRPTPKPRPTKSRKKGKTADTSRIGMLRESRLQLIVEKCPTGKELYFKDVAKMAGLSDTDAGNALNAAKRLGWRSESGVTVTQTHRGYYVLNSPGEDS